MKGDWKNWLLFTVLSVIWGSSFFFMKHSMFTPEREPIFSNTQVASIRMLVASSILLPFGLTKLRKIANIKLLGALLVVGFCGNFVPAFLFTYSQQHLDAGYVGMLNSATPIFTVLISFFAFGQRLSGREIIGLVIGNVGIVLLVYAGNGVSLSGSLIHVLAVVLATLFYAISLNTIKYYLHDLKALHITALAFSFTFIPALLLFFYTDTPSVFYESAYAWRGFSFAFTLACLGTVIGVYLYNVLIARSSTLFASSVTYAMPCVAVLIGLADNEEFHAGQIGALGIILAGIFIANWRKNKQVVVN
jgi:drug/metabolite transporter (DMT)-like permease